MNKNVMIYKDSLIGGNMSGIINGEIVIKDENIWVITREYFPA